MKYKHMEQIIDKHTNIFCYCGIKGKNELLKLKNLVSLFSLSFSLFFTVNIVGQNKLKSFLI